MNSLDKQYTALLQDILDNGVTKSDRTGTGTLSVFGRQIRHKMSEGFPAVTTKKLHFKGVVSELLWFLNGRTDLRYLLEHNNFIWVGDAYKKYMETINEIIEHYKSGDMLGSQPHIENMFSDSDNLIPLSEKEFIEKIKSDDEFDKKFGDLGPIYGKQWRKWNGVTKKSINGTKLFSTGFTQIDQIQNLINDLKTNPDSRRLMVTAWNPAELDQMTLPPCHYGFQVYTRELSFEERKDWWNKGVERGSIIYDEIYDKDEYSFIMDKEELDRLNIPTRAISLMWNQRSVDTFLGLPFNIASYGLLLEIIAKAVNMVPDELVGNLGDTHLYLNHVEQAKEQIGRELTHEERCNLLKDAMSHRIYNKTVNELMPFGGGMSEYYESHNIPRRTRESYPLPTLKHLKTDEFYKALSEDTSLFAHLDPTDFQVENYQAHPHIKAPLSN